MGGHAAAQISMFVSYAHADTRHRPHIASSRLGELLEDLRYDLGAHDPRSPYRFLRDIEGMIRAGDSISARIEDHMETTDLALICLSEHYCSSESCRKELESFVAMGKRLVLIELDEVWSTSSAHGLVDLRARVDDILSIRFWSPTGQGIAKHGFPLPRSAPPASQQAYQETLERLVRDIRALSGELMGQRTPAPGASPPAPAPETVAAEQQAEVVLAAPTSDTRVDTDRLAHSFADAGFSVIRLDPADHETTATRLRSALGTPGTVFVQVLSALPGRLLPACDNLPSTIAQHRIAVDCRAETAAWTNGEFDPSECAEDYAAFLRAAVTHRSSLEDFETYAIKLLEERRKRLRSEERRAAAQDTVPGTDPPLVSIDAAQVDAALRDRIKTALDKHVHVDCIDYNASMDALEEAVQDNDAIVLVYGEQAEGRKRAKAHFRFFRRWRRAIWSEERQRFEIAFGDASPVGDCPSGPGIHVIRIGDDLDPGAVQTFLQSLGVQTHDGLH